MNRRKYLSNIFILSSASLIVPQLVFLTGCDEDKNEGDYVNLIQIIFGNLLAQQLLKYPAKNEQVIIELIRSLPKQRSIAGLARESMNSYYVDYPPIDLNTATQKYYDSCKNYLIQNNTLINQAETAKFGSDAINKITSFGVFDPMSAAAFSLFTYATSKGLDHFIENEKSEIMKSPFYSEELNKCVLGRSLHEFSNNSSYEQHFVKVNPDVFKVDKETYVKDNLGDAAKQTLQKVKTTTDKKEIYSAIDLALNETAKSVDQIKEYLSLQINEQQRQLEKQKKIDSLQSNLRDLDGIISIASFTFAKLLNDPKSAQDIERAAGALATLYKSTAEYVIDPQKMSALAMGGTYVAAFSMLSGMMSGGDDVSEIILANLEKIHKQLIEIQQQLSRIETNQAVILKALNALFQEIRQQSYQINNSLRNIENAIFYGLAYSASDDRKATRLEFVSILDNYNRLMASKHRKSSIWIADYKNNVLQKITDYAKNKSKLPRFTGATQSITNLDQIPGKIKVTGYLDLMLGSLVEMVNLAGIVTPFADLSNPYEWSLGVNSFIEARLANLDIEVPEEKSSLKSLYDEGKKISYIISTSVNINTGKKVNERAKAILGINKYENFRKEYFEIISSKINDVSAIEYFKGQNIDTTLSKPTKAKQFEVIQEVLCDTTKEESINIKLNNDLLGIFYQSVAAFENQDQFGFKNYAVSHYPNSLAQGGDTVYFDKGRYDLIKVDHDPFDECIRRKLIEKKLTNQVGSDFGGWWTYSLIDTKFNEEIFPGSIYVESFTKSDAMNGWSREFILSEDRDRVHGVIIKWSPRVLFNYCVNKLRLDFQAKFRVGIVPYLAKNLVGQQVTNQSEGILSLYKILAAFAQWRKAEIDDLPLIKEEISENNIKKGNIIDEYSKRFHFNNIDSAVQLNELLAILEKEIQGIDNTSAPSSIGLTSKDGKTYSRCSFDDPKSTYLPDIFLTMFNILTKNLKYMEDFFNSMPQVRTLPIVDNTLIRIRAYLIMRGLNNDNAGHPSNTVI